MPALVNGNLFFDMEPRDDDQFINISITSKDQSTSGSDPYGQQQQQQQQQGNLQMYYLTPSFSNAGTQSVTFKFPPKDGRVISLPPYGQVHLNAREGGFTKPDDVVIEFEEAGKKYNVTLAWEIKPSTNVSVAVGNGKAIIETDSSNSTSGNQTSATGDQAQELVVNKPGDNQGPMSKSIFLALIILVQLP